METRKNFAFKRSSVKKTLPKGKLNHGNLEKLPICAKCEKNYGFGQSYLKKKSRKTGVREGHSSVPPGVHWWPQDILICTKVLW